MLKHYTCILYFMRVAGDRLNSSYVLEKVFLLAIVAKTVTICKYTITGLPPPYSVAESALAKA